MGQSTEWYRGVLGGTWEYRVVEYSNELTSRTEIGIKILLGDKLVLASNSHVVYCLYSSAVKLEFIVYRITEYI